MHELAKRTLRPHATVMSALKELVNMNDSPGKVKFLAMDHVTEEAQETSQCNNSNDYKKDVPI